jgi:hypothetical protein
MLGEWQPGVEVMRWRDPNEFEAGGGVEEIASKETLGRHGRVLEDIREMPTPWDCKSRSSMLASAGRSSGLRRFYARATRRPLCCRRPLFYSRRIQVVVLAARHTIPTIDLQRDFPEAGGLRAMELA